MLGLQYHWISGLGKQWYDCMTDTIDIIAICDGYSSRHILWYDIPNNNKASNWEWRLSNVVCHWLHENSKSTLSTRTVYTNTFDLSEPQSKHCSRENQIFSMLKISTETHIITKFWKSIYVYRWINIVSNQTKNHIYGRHWDRLWATSLKCEAAGVLW